MAMEYELPPIAKVNSLPASQKEELLDHLFEPCATLKSYLISRIFNNNHKSYHDLVEAARIELFKLLSMPSSKPEQYNPSVDPRIFAIIAAHPRLGSPKVQKLSAHSSNEQKSLNTNVDPEESRKLQDLNQLYEKKFPGLRYVVFVNGRSRSVIMENMKERIGRGNINLEMEDALNAMCDIAIDRANKLSAKL